MYVLWTGMQDGDSGGGGCEEETNTGNSRCSFVQLSLNILKIVLDVEVI